MRIMCRSTGCRRSSGMPKASGCWGAPRSSAPAIGLADAIGQEIAGTASSGPGAPQVTVIDPFAGSGNTLYWILRHLPQSRGIGFEVDAQVFQLTRKNL